MLPEGKEEITIDPAVATMGYGEPQYIGCYRKLAMAAGEDRAISLYSGMSPEKSSYILSAGDGLDAFSVRWTLERLKEIVDNGFRTRNQMLHPAKKKKHRAEEYDFPYDDCGDDEFCGSRDTVTYARWLYNRYGAGSVSEHFGVTRYFAERLGTSSVYGGTAVSELKGDIKELNRLEREAAAREAEREERWYTQMQVNAVNNRNLESFREGGSRKLKVRMNRLMDIPAVFVLKKLLEAEEFNIAAKDCYYKYVDYNYGKKGQKLREAIEKLPDTGWHYWWQRDADGVASYIFYVELPGGVQVSWHGMDLDDMEGVPETMYREWDGQRASTLPKLIDCIKSICPGLVADKFDNKKCREEIASNLEIKEKQ